MIALEDNPEHGDLIALDPSVNSPGVALFRFGILHRAARVKIPASWAKDMSPGARWLRVATAIRAWWEEQCTGGREVLRGIVYECPQIYRNSKSKGDPNLLLGLVGVASSFAAIMTTHNLVHEVRPPEIVTPTPAEWIGQLPKSTRGSAWASPRGKLVWSALQPGEREVVPDQHDAVDAVGLGLWRLKRLHAKRRVFPGAV